MDEKAALLGLLQVACMALVPAILECAISRALRLRPSYFLAGSLSAYYPAVRGVTLLWFAVAALLLVGSGSMAAFPAIAAITGATLVLAAAAVMGVHRKLLPRLQSLSGAMAMTAAGDFVQLNEDGCFQVSGTRLNQGFAISSVRAFFALFLFVAVFSLGLIACLATRLVISGNGPPPSALLVLVGHWISLGVICIDLAQDAVPGATSAATLRRSFLYYVRIFEHQKNLAILLGLAISLFVAPAAYLAGTVPAAAAWFSLWLAACVVFATLWNKVLVPAGTVSNPLPLPMGRNHYSERDPLWAHFLTVIHAIMAACLVAGIYAINNY